MTASSPLVRARAFAPADAEPADSIELPFAAREKSRFRARLRSGEEIGIDLAPGTLIRHGALLALEDGRVVAVEAAPEPLMQVDAEDAAALARLAYHVGNRHVPLQIGDRWLRLLPDHVLRAMLERLGGQVHELEARFEPESGAYGHSHVHHQHDDQGHGGQIHAFDPRHEAGHAHGHGHSHGHGHDHSHGHDHGHGHAHAHGHSHGHGHGHERNHEH